MGPEVWVGIAAVFVSGGAIGAAGTLMAQWVVRKIGGEPLAPPRPALESREAEILRMEVADLTRQLSNMDARLEFQEQLLGGSLSGSAPPPRLERPVEPEPDGPGDGDASG